MKEQTSDTLWEARDAPDHDLPPAIALDRAAMDRLNWLRAHPRYYGGETSRERIHRGRGTAQDYLDTGIKEDAE